MSPTLRVTFEIPSQHQSNKLPILDTQMWIEDGRVLHEFYEKSMTSDYVIRADSAQPNSMKRTCLIEEGVRRLRNCSPSLDWETKVRHMEKYA